MATTETVKEFQRFTPYKKLGLNQSYGKLGVNVEDSLLYDPKPEPENKVRCRASIVGTYYRNPREKDAMYRAKPGDEIMLIRDKANQFSNQAVKCMIKQHHVGYLSQSDADLYGRVMDRINKPMLMATLIRTTDKYPLIEFETDNNAVSAVQVKLAQSDFE